MKILYAIQGTGNGHLSRAHDVIPALLRHGEVDILVSGTQAEVTIPFKINYRLKGMSFIFGKSGGVDLMETFLRTDLIRLIREIRDLQVKKYDLIVNDFEPVSAWAARWRNVPIISLSHQSALLFSSSPKPNTRDFLGEAVIKYYAPADIRYGFHFHRFSDNISTPVIRQQVRQQKVSNHGHYTVYLPFYSTEKIGIYLSAFPDIEWQVFSKHSMTTSRLNNIYFRPVMSEAFVESMASATGVLCGAGFETPAEALFMGKKLLVMPMHGQFEQQCNAAALEQMGVRVIRRLNKKYSPVIREWLDSNERIHVNYPDITQSLISHIIEHYYISYKSGDPGFQGAGPALF